MQRAFLVVLAAMALLSSFEGIGSAQEGKGNPCTPAGVWYGGSVVAYRMTITPAGPAGQFTILTEAMYKNAVLSTMWAGQITKRGKKYEGSMSSLSTQDRNI